MKPGGVLVVWNVRSRHNVGSFFRTSDAAGISHIHLCGITPAPPHSRIEKVSLGAEKKVPFSAHTRILPLIKKLKRAGYTILGLECTSSSIPYTQYHAEHKRPFALVVGSEVDGLSSSILQQCDTVLHIPMHGMKESLNVSVAYGIAVYALMYPQNT